jgi:hypothetical protein
VRGGGVIVPFQDYSLLWSQPRLGPGARLRLDVRGAFTDESTLKFYGMSVGGHGATMPNFNAWS